jgi:hypothetical protein
MTKKTGNIHHEFPSVSHGDRYPTSEGLSTEDSVVKLELCIEQLVAEGVISAEELEELRHSAHDLILTFGVSPEFFDTSFHGMVLMAVAKEHLVDLRQISDEADTEVQNHQLFVRSLMALLTTEHKSFGSEQVDDTRVMEVYDKFTNWQLTEDLKRQIESSGMLRSVQERMGITEPEQIEIRVLNLVGDDTYASYLLPPSVDPAEYAGDYTNPELRSRIKKHEEDRELLEGYLARLRRSTLDYNLELGRDGDAPNQIAWVKMMGDRQVMVLPAPIAELLAYPAEERARHFKADEFERLVSILEHEYVHTQGGVLAESGLGLGIGLEEVRAEHFSGNKHGYQDVKRHFAYKGVAEGVKIRDMLDSYAVSNPYSPDSFYLQISKNLGLGGLLDATLAFPRVYVEAAEPNSPFRIVDEYVGGLDGLEERSFSRMVENGKLEQVVAAAQNMLKKLTIDPERFFGYTSPTFYSKLYLSIWEKMKSEDNL